MGNPGRKKPNSRQAFRTHQLSAPFFHFGTETVFGLVKTIGHPVTVGSKISKFIIPARH